MAVEAMLASDAGKTLAAPIGRGGWRLWRLGAYDQAAAERPLRPRALVLFAGRLERRVHLPSSLADAGFDVDVLDAHRSVGGKLHDLHASEVRAGVMGDIENGTYAVVCIATPCGPYSVLHDPPLYTRSGKLAVPAAWRAHKARTDSLALFTAEAVAAAEASGALWLLENPADRGEVGSPAYWPAHADHHPLWMQPALAAELAKAGCAWFTFAFCAFGAEEQKWTTVAASRRLEGPLSFLHDAGCKHGTQRHAKVAAGRDHLGRSNAQRSGEYPAALCSGLAAAMAFELESPRATQPMGVSSGAGLDDSVAARIDELRRAPPAFASLGNLRELHVERLIEEPMPPSIEIPRRLGRRRRRKGRSRPPLPRASQPEERSGWDPRQLSGHGVTRPAGKISLRQLFLPGVYDEQVETWWPLVTAAKAAISARAAGDDVPIPRVPTRVIEQWQQPLWARADVWDCRDPEDCVPVKRTSASTPEEEFKGRRRLDRQALRAAAAALRWGDTDIVEQVCGGGVEARSTCERITVLAFHHPGLADDFEAAAAVVAAHLAEEWVEPPVQHLPFVPCRLQPRDVIMQDRYRVREGEHDGQGRPAVEAYLKPRVTTNSSHGGEDSVNAGVAADEKHVDLPCVQWLARALAVCDEAGWEAEGEEVEAAAVTEGAARRRADGSTERRKAAAAAYCVDAESAYSFCHVQRADWWLQCFVWWNEDGEAGVCVDMRMGFGGAFAPNRFERVSSLVAAYIRSLQSAFDEAQPPTCAAPWVARRAELQAEGKLPPGADQIEPAYRMVFIDDFAGCALDDEVAPPKEVADIIITSTATEATGGKFAPAGTRVHVHAQLAVLGLRRVGLSAAPGKVTVGDGITVLGFAVWAAARRLHCPPLKRATLLHQIGEMERAAVEGVAFDGSAARRLVGRLNNMSQVFPELAGYMHGGYTATMAHSRGCLLRTIRLGRSGSTTEAWLELLQVSQELLGANEGVPLAPDLVFPGRLERGVALAITDASGAGGVGGYVFLADQPGQVWIVCEQWHGAIAAARAQADLEARHRTAGAPALSMPAAELFGSWAVPLAAARAAAVKVTAVIAVTDCEPAAAALNRAAGGRIPQMRLLTRAARGWVQHWLAVHIPRELNADADVLSHPGGARAIAAKARAAGLVPHVVRVSRDEWRTLALAAATGTGRVKATAEASRGPTGKRRKMGP